MFTCVYELVLSIDAIHHKNNLLLFAICISNTCVLVFSGMHTKQIEDTSLKLFSEDYGNMEPLVNTKINFWQMVRGFQIACPIIIGLCCLITWPCAFQLHKDYAWAIYRKICGDAKTRSRYLAYEVGTGAS